MGLSVNQAVHCFIEDISFFLGAGKRQLPNEVPDTFMGTLGNLYNKLPQTGMNKRKVFVMIRGPRQTLFVSGNFLKNIGIVTSGNNSPKENTPATSANNETPHEEQSSANKTEPMGVTPEDGNSSEAEEIN